MELSPVINEPAIIGTALVLLALHVLVQPTGWFVPRTPALSLAQRDTWVLCGVYVLFSTAVGLLVYAIQALLLPLFGAVIVSCLLVAFGTLQQGAVRTVSMNRMVQAVAWNLICFGVAVVLIWWWPW